MNTALSASFICWKDGDYLAFEKQKIELDDRGFSLGDGVFDTLLINAGQPQYLDYHISRLKEHANLIDLKVPESLDNLGGIVKDLVLRNNLSKGRASLRTTLTRGRGPRGLMPPCPCHPSMIVTISSLPEHLCRNKKISLILPVDLSRNEKSVLSRIKSLSYADCVLAIIRARQRGSDNAAFINTKGFLSCAANGNIYFYLGGGWKTPPIKDGVLNGTIRQILINKRKVSEQSIHESELLDVKAMAISNSLVGLQNVSRLGDVTFKEPERFNDLADRDYRLEENS